MTSIHQALRPLLSGKIAQTVDLCVISHALTQWSKGQKTPFFASLVALDARENHKAPIAKGLTIDRIRSMLPALTAKPSDGETPHTSAPAIRAMLTLLELLEKGVPAKDCAALLVEKLKAERAAYKTERADAIDATRTQEQKTARELSADKAATDKATKTTLKAYEAALALINGGMLTATQMHTLKLDLSKAWDYAESQGKTVIAELEAAPF